MPLVGAAAAAAASAGVGTSVFGYNRENFLYDRKMRQEAEYQIMDFRIKQAGLWREDVRDIIGLTSVKMDTYLVVNAVQLGFTVAAFCEGRLATGTPSWLVGCHTLSLAGAFMYLLMSVWFSMHASVTAKSYEVRLLTQLVRLPVPSWSQLEGARTYASGFEKTDTKQMFRVPFAMGTQERVLGQSASEESSCAGVLMAAQSGEAAEEQSVGSADLWGLEGRGDKIYELDASIRTNPDEQRHLQLIKQVMHYWQSYDGFARVAMSMGTNQLIMGLSYYVMAYVLISNKAIIASFLVVLLFMVVATALIRLDMSLTGLEFRTAATLVMAGPCITAVAAWQWRQHTVQGFEVVHVLAPLPYAFSAGWLMFLLYIARVEQQEGGAMLPTGFRSVMYIDVFGWLKRGRRLSDTPSAATLPPNESTQTPAATAMTSPPTSGVGPAVQTVNYTGYLFKSPSPTRPEQLAGAREPLRHDLATPEMFDPTTFVPREIDDEGMPLTEEDVQPHLRPGFVPWRIFCSATTMLIFLWWLSGVLVLLQASGWTVLRVAPLLREEGGDHSPHSLDEGHGASFMVMATGSSNGKRSFMQLGMHSATELMGEHLDTQWPHLAGASPRHLACGMDADGKTAVVAASRFGLFLSRMEPAVKGKHGYKLSTDSNSTAIFQYAPACDDLDGEAVQDVSMMCGGKEGHCQALVLHRQGQRLAACGLSAWKASELTTGRDSLPALMSLSDGWLGEGDAAANQPQEEVESIAMAGRCPGADQGQCAFAETTSGRLVEFKTGLAKDSGSTVPDWYPSRVLFADASSKAREGGTLHMLGDGYVGVLAKDGKELRALDPRSGTKVVGRWPLPADRRWTSMCSSAGSLYLLSEGSLEQPPQLYRFPVPSSLYDAAETKPSHAVHSKQWISAVQMRKHASSSRDHILATAMS